MKEPIRKFLDSHRATRNPRPFTDSESLLEAGIIDSMGMVDLIGHLESEFGISIDEDDMTPENFDSVDAICTYVSQKKS